MKNDPLTDLINGDYERKQPNFKSTIMLLLALVILVLPTGVWIISDAAKPISFIPNAIETEGVITSKSKRFVRKGLDKRTILYWYNEDGAISSEVHSNERSSTEPALGRGHKQLVSYSFFRSIKVGDKVTVRYKPDASPQKSYIKGATPVWYIIFNSLLGLILICSGLLSFFIVRNFRA